MHCCSLGRSNTGGGVAGNSILGWEKLEWKVGLIPQIRIYLNGMQLKAYAI